MWAQTYQILDLSILDGPNFALGWITGENILQFPSAKTMGLLVSTTQQLVVRASKEAPSLQNLFKDVQEGCYTLNHVLQYAKEVFVMSSTRGIIPVDRIGQKNFEIPDGNGIVAQLQKNLEKFVLALEE